MMSDFYKFPSSNNSGRVPPQPSVPPQFNAGIPGQSASIFPDNLEELPHNFSSDSLHPTNSMNNQSYGFEPNSLENFSQDLDELFMNEGLKGADGSYPFNMQQHMGSIRLQQNSNSMNLQQNFPSNPMTPQFPPNSPSLNANYTNAELGTVESNTKLASLLSAWMSEKGLDFNNKKRKQSDSSPPPMIPPHSPAMVPPPNNQSNRSYVIPNPNTYNNNPVSMPMSPSIPSPSTLPPQSQMQVSMNNYQNFHIPPSRFDLAIAKAKLVDLVCGEKDLDKFCGKATGFICQHLNLSIGGFYMNERQNLKDWTMYCAYPSLPVFSAHFHFDVGFHLLMQAAVEKRCFSVNSTTSNGELTFLFVPIPSDTGNSMGVMVLGTSLKAETDTQAYLSFLEQIRKPMANALASLRSMQQNLLLLERLDLLIRENEIFRQRNRFDKALVNILSTVTAADVSIICTDTRGTITYFSPGAQHLLGYQATEIVGVSTPLLLHAPREIDERSKQIEAETGRKVSGFGVFVENPQRTGLEETRKWTYVKKDGTQIKVSLSVKPIYDDAARIIGYVGIAKEVPAINSNSNV